MQYYVDTNTSASARSASGKQLITNNNKYDVRLSFDGMQDWS